MNIQQFEHYAEIHTDPELDQIPVIEKEEEEEEIELVSAEVLAAEAAATVAEKKAQTAPHGITRVGIWLTHFIGIFAVPFILWKEKNADMTIPLAIFISILALIILGLYVFYIINSSGHTWLIVYNMVITTVLLIYFSFWFYYKITEDDFSDNNIVGTPAYSFILWGALGFFGGVLIPTG